MKATKVIQVRFEGTLDEASRDALAAAGAQLHPPAGGDEQHVAELLAGDPEEARQRVREALEPFGGFSAFSASEPPE
jgi:hypothetical protein